MRIEQAQLVRAPREQVFQAWTDCESWPKWDPVLFTRVTVAERVGNTARLDAETKFMGLRMRRTERHILTPPEKVEVTGDVPDATNTTVWKFDAVPEGTVLTAVIEAQFKGMLKLLQPIAEWQARAVTRKWMQAFATYVETKQPD
jgi:ribosome-associated toxin RatA of RatAB toxin-antitoxin module